MRLFFWAELEPGLGQMVVLGQKFLTSTLFGSLAGMSCEDSDLELPDSEDEGARARSGGEDETGVAARLLKPACIC